MFVARIAELKSDQRIKELDARGIEVSKSHAKCEAELISIFQEMDKLRGFLEFEFASLFEYATKRLKLSESTALNLIGVARKSVEVPELKIAIEAGEISVSKARKIAPVITKENKELWIEIASTKTSREIEKAVATEKPELLIQESVKYKASDRIEFKTGISEALLKKLDNIRDLESQRTSKAVNFEEVLEAMAIAYLEKFDPIRKAERAAKRNEKADASAHVPGHVLEAGVSKPSEFKVERIDMPFRREVIHSALKHAVTMRDQRRCTHIYKDGSRCECTRWLDVHHIVPVSEGGTNELRNLKTLCRSHHQMIHRH